MSAQQPTTSELVATAILGVVTVLVFYVALLLAPPTDTAPQRDSAPITTTSTMETNR